MRSGAFPAIFGKQNLTSHSELSVRRKIMAKGQQSKKDEKKKPEKTLKEKRAEKRAKKEGKAS